MTHYINAEELRNNLTQEWLKKAVEFIVNENSIESQLINDIKQLFLEAAEEEIKLYLNLDRKIYALFELARIRQNTTNPNSEGIEIH